MMTVVLTTCDGESYTLPMLLQWEVSYTGGVPCDSLLVSCLYEAEMGEMLPRASRLSALVDGVVMFTGVVDAYEISFSQRGLLVEVEGRGMAALLLDNESEAVRYERAVTREIVENHVAPYGIEVGECQELYENNYAVTSGSSQWKALRDFVHRAGGFEPYFTREGILVVAPLSGSGRTLTVGDDTPLLSLEKREKRYGVISEVLIQDKVQGVSHSVVNEPFVALGGCRRHVLYMPRSTPDARRYSGEYQIQQSARERLEIDLELPAAFAAFPGERVALGLTRPGLHGLYDVAEARSRMDAGGERTILTLREVG